MTEQYNDHDDPETDAEGRIRALEVENEALRQNNLVQELVIKNYQQALANATHRNAVLAAQHELATQPTE
ncbi:hypothetical protein [Glutamicibacter arilaitensis]|uniref:hypothetical protein n=1 Tax=Glutamicibacter arilaitensis TaxID=256701 RepID=UPI003FD125C1